MRSVTGCRNALLAMALSLVCSLGVPSMALAADSADASGSEAAASAPASTEVGPAYANDGESGATASDAASTAVPIWEFSGVSLSASRVTSGQPVTVTPQVSGDLDGATYNYVWQRDGSWAEGEWGSTVLSTGRGTSEQSATLSSEVSRAGTYTLYVDVTDHSGQKRTMSAELEAYDDSWSLDGVVATPSSVVAGDEVTYAPKVSGDTSGLTYNYVWQWEGSWAEGDWGSTELYTGADTTEASHTGALGAPGRYTLYVDVVSARGERRTASAEVVAWGVTGVSVSGSAASGWTARADLFDGREVSGALYRFRWISADGSASGTLNDWSSTTSVSFSRDTLNSSATTYEIYLDVKCPNGKQLTFSAEVHKSGWYTSGGSWHYAYDSGSDATGWASINGYWYYFNGYGVMQTGWLNQGGKTYYLDPSTGKMATGFAAGSYFDPDGVWLCYSGEASSAVNIARSVGSPTNYLLLIDNSNCTTWVFKWVNGDWCAIYKWICSPGKASTPTVRGTYSIGSRGYSFGNGFTCYYWTQFYGNYLFHSILYYQGTRSVMDGTLGVPASHGCVRLDINNAYWINRNVPTGTRVYSY